MPILAGVQPVADILFDLDGTLFRTETVDIEAHNRALADFGLPEREDKQILELIGYTMNKICAILLGKTDRGRRQEFEEAVITYELQLIPGKGELYEGVQEVLRELMARGYRLHVCTNGGTRYVHAILAKFKLEDVFESVWCKAYGVSKARAVGKMIKRYRMRDAYYVGDRLGDWDAATANQCRFVGAIYGFGREEVVNAELRIESPVDLLSLFRATQT